MSPIPINTENVYLLISKTLSALVVFDKNYWEKILILKKMFKICSNTFY